MDRRSSQSGDGFFADRRSPVIARRRRGLKAGAGFAKARCPFRVQKATFWESPSMSVYAENGRPVDDVRFGRGLVGRQPLPEDGRRLTEMRAKISIGKCVRSQMRGWSGRGDCGS